MAQRQTDYCSPRRSRRLVAAAAILIPALLVPATFAQAGATSVNRDKREPLSAFVLKRYDGGQIDLASYRGTVVLVNFWATWCPPCVAEFPSLLALRDEFADQPFEILAVNWGERDDAIAGFIDSLGRAVNFPILVDRSVLTVAEDWPVRALPTTIIVDKRGNLAFRITGDRDWNSARSQALIRSFLDE